MPIQGGAGGGGGGSGSAPATAPWQIPYSGAAVSLPYSGYQNGTAALTDQVLWLYPLPLQAAKTITALTIRTNGAAGAGATIRFGIYADSGSGEPTGAAVYDSGAIAATSAFSNIGASGLSQARSAGLTWIALVQQGAPSPAVTPNTFTSTVIPLIPADTATHALSPLVYAAYQMTAIGSGALPTIAGLSLAAITGASNMPIVAVTF